MPEPEITKRRVTMTSVVAVGTDENGDVQMQRHEAVDFVRPDFLDAYIADARSRWQVITVSDEPDAGPLGYDGPTFVPPGLDVPDAGLYFPATSGSEVEAALIEAGDLAAIATEGSDTPALLTTILEG